MGDRALRHDLGHWGMLSDGWQLVAATFDPLVASRALRLEVCYARTNRREVRRFVLHEQVNKEGIWQRVS
jgi:hypothetical protein